MSGDRRPDARAQALSRPQQGIVRETELLIAAPAEFSEQHRSGTWSTVRYARRLGRPVQIIGPDGRIRTEPRKGASAGEGSAGSLTFE